MSKTYRYTFTDETLNMLNSFATIHKHEERKEFKESWENWLKANSSVVEKERERICNEGYDGKIEEKMYTSVRYYFRKKSVKDDKPKSRRSYIKIDKKLLEMINMDISDNLLTNDDFKPSTGYDNFYSHYYDRMIKREINRIMEEHDMQEEDVENKIKKTYKNRYFNLKQQN